MPAGYDARPEQILVFRVKAWDTNCHQHIPQRIDAAEIVELLASRDQRIAELEEEVKSLKTQGMLTKDAI